MSGSDSTAPRATARAPWREEIEQQLAEVDRLVRPEDRAERLVAIADRLREVHGEPGEASEYYFQAVAVHPEAPERGLSRLAKLARETGDVAVTANLVAGLSHAGHWEDVVTVLVRRAEGTVVAEERVGLLLEAARTCLTRLGDRAQARDHLVAAARDAPPAMAGEILGRLRGYIDEYPGDAEAAQVGARMAVDAGLSPDAITILERAVAHHDALEVKAALLLDLAGLCEGAERPVEALKHLYEAWHYDSDLAHAACDRIDGVLARWRMLPEVIEQGAAIYDRMGLAERVHATLSAPLEALAGDERATAVLRLAEHAEYQLVDPTRAFELYRKGLEEGHGELGAFAAGMRRVGAEGVQGAVEVMTELFGRLGMWRALVHVFDGEAAVEVEDERRADLLHRAGEVLETHLEDLSGAVERYVKAFRLEPHEPRHLVAGERVYRRRGDWQMVDRLLGLQVQIAAEDISDRLLVEQGRVRHRELARPLDAYDALAGPASRGWEPAVAALGDLARDDEAFAAVERGLRKRAAAEGATEAARLLQVVAALQLDHRGRTDLAVAAMREAADLAPTDETLFGRVGELLEAHATLGELGRWLASAAQRPLPDAARVEALRRAGEALAASGEPGGARDALTALLEISPRAPGALTAALEQARAADEPAPLARLLDGALAGRAGPESPEPETRLGWLREVAVARGALGDAAEAADAWRSLLAEVPGDEQALAFLRRWHTVRGEWEALRATVETFAEARRDAGDPAPALWQELAEIAELRLGDPRLAAVYLRPLLELPEAAEEARAELHRMYAAAGDREGEIGLLELELAAEASPAGRRSLAERVAGLADQDPRDDAALVRALRVLAELAEDRLPALDRLAGALRRAEAAPQLVDVLAERWAAHPTDDALDVLRERARLLAALGRAEEAADAWGQVVERSAADDDLSARQSACAAVGDWRSVCALLERRRAVAEGAAARRTLLREVAVVAEVQLGEPERAVAAWAAILDADPADAEAPGELVRLYEAAGDWVRYLELGRAQLDGLPPSERLDLARSLARVAQDELSRPADALAFWEVVQRIDPMDVEALEGRLAAAEQVGEPGALAAALAALARVVERPRQYALLTRRAELLQELGDVPAAIDAWESVREVGPPLRAPLTAIRELALVRKDYWNASRALAAELAFVDDPAERLELDRTLGRICDRELGDQLGAVAAWERVLEAAPADPEALEALKGLYAELGRSAELVRVLRDLLAGAADDEERVRLLVDAAALVETTRGDHAEAFECWWRALRLSSDAPPHMVAELRRLAEETGLWERYVEVLRLVRTRARKPSQQVELLLQESRLCAERLGEPTAAFDRAAEAFAIVPGDNEALEVMSRLAPRTQTWAPLVDALRRVADGGVDRSRRAELLAQAAGILEGHLGKPEVAFELYAAIDRPDDLVRLAETHGLWDELVAVFTRRWQSQSQTVAQLGTLHQLARLLEERAESWESAFEQYLLALQLEPRDEATREEVWRLAEAHDAWPLVCRVLELKASAADETWLQVALLRDVAKLQSEALGEGRKAFETLRRAFAVEPWNESTLGALGEVADQTGAWRELAEFLEEEARWAQEHHGRLRLYRAAIDVLKRHGDAAEAARLVKRVAELAPGDDAAAAEELALLRDSEDHSALAEALERQARGARPEARAALLAELAELYAGPLELPKRAEGVYQRLLALRPGDDGAFEAMATSLADRSAWAELAEALDKRLAGRRGEVAHQLLRRRAEILQTHLGRRAEAYRLMARIARDRPEDVDLLFELAERAEGKEAWGELLACAERSLDVVDPDHLPAVLVLVGRTARERFGNEKRARQCLARALELVPDDVEVARELAELLEKRGLWAELADLLATHGPTLEAREGEGGDDDATRSRWALRLAGLQADHLFKLDEAVRTLRTHVHRQPHDQEALRLLQGVARRAQAPAELLLATIQLAEQVAEGRVEVLSAGARDLAAMGDPKGAVALWRAVLEAVPDHAEALRVVGEVAERRRDWDLKAEELSSRARAADGDGARARVLCELATLHREQREDPAAAREAFEAALRADPSLLDARVGLAQLLRAMEEVADAEAAVEGLAGALDAAGEAASAPHADAAAELQWWRAEVAAAREDEALALSCLLEAHDRAPERADIGQALADALYRSADLRAAAAIYGRLPAPAQPSDVARAEEHLRRARAFASVGRDEQAVHHFEAAALHEPTRVQAMSALANLHESGARWEAAVRLREKLAAVAESKDARCAALVAAGTLAESRLGQAARAVGFYERALDEGLDDLMLLARAFPLIRAHGNGARGLVVARRLLDAEEDINQKAELWCAIGQLHLDDGGREEAAAAFRAALDLSPLQVEAARGLLTASDKPTEAVRVVFDGARTVKDRAKAPLLELLGAHLRQAGDHGGAIEVYEELNALDPNHLGARAALAELYERQPPDASDMDHFRRALGHRLAYLRGNPGDPEGLRHLARLYEAVGHPEWAATPLRLLAMVKAADRREVERARERTAAPADATPGAVPLPPLTPALRHELVADATLRSPVGALMAWLHEALAEVIDGLFAPAAPLPGEPADVVHPPLAEQVEALARVLDVPPRRLWLTNADDRTISLVRLHPPELVAGGALAHGLFAPERRFVLARALELTRGAAVFAAYVPEAEARALYRAALSLGAPSDGPPPLPPTGVDPERVQFWSELLDDALDAEGYVALAHHARPAASAGPEGFDGWARAVRRTADRVGLVMAGDLARVLTLLLKEAGGGKPPRIAGPSTFRALLETHPEIAELHGFAFGPAWLDLQLAMSAE